ncbi:MAG: SDR family oxidoreductase [Gemmataceae bacterium]|nr:SDR family oxidoreductase [Gemmataceae bacterium]
MSGRLQGKRCLIVGGTSGIGWAAGKRFLQEGARLAIAGLDEPQSHEGIISLMEAAGPCLSIGCDARDPKQVDEALAFTIQVLGGLDVLYHVAGGSGRRHGDGPLHECTDEGWQYTLDLNLSSVFLTNRAAVQHFLAYQQPGVILNLASVLALAPAPRHFDTCAYTAAKGGVIALSRLAAARYAADGIRVNVLAPGLIDTPMAARAVSDPVILDYLRAKQPLRGGPGQADDCSDAAVFLCSDEARFITGSVLPVDGGWCVGDGCG